MMNKEFEVLALHFLSQLNRNIESLLYLIKSNPKDLDRHINALSNNSKRLARYISQIELINKLKSYTINPSSFNISSVISEIERDYPEVVWQGRNLYIKTDRLLLKEMLCQLIDNSYKFKEDLNIRININKNKSCIYIELIDSGIGIDKSFVDFLYQPFKREDVNKGIGLGLFIVKNIVCGLQGSINITLLEKGLKVNIKIKNYE